MKLRSSTGSSSAGPSERSGTVAAARRADAWWARATVVAMLALAAFGGTAAIRFSTLFSGSAVVAGLVLLAVSAALVRSRLGALADLKSETSLRGVPTYPESVAIPDGSLGGEKR